MILLKNLILERSVVDKSIIKDEFKKLKRIFKDINGLDIDIEYSKLSNVLTLHWIEVDDEYRGNGIATNVLNKLNLFADKYQLDIELIADSEEGYDQNKLIAYYEKFGYVIDNDDTDEFNNTYMIRKYKKIR